MRLLKQLWDGEFSLTELSQDIPPYAILSHTWSDEEVTFRDVTERTGMNKQGYRKLNFCARQAARDSIAYFWVDTCCIDKSNSTELSEAINSMFRWYQQSAKCYAYLSDVSNDHNIEPDEPSRSTWKLDFRKSRWFTRGWTLQELLAPTSVEFFSREGQRLGDKRSLEALLADITHIPVSALQGGSLFRFSVSERMAWSNGRLTTREEDVAYCLFGILGVFLPPIYGEGGQNAMSRLRREISTTEDARAAVLAKLPSAYGASFDSHAEEHSPTCHPETRVELLYEINTWIRNPMAKAMFWLDGMAGTGKSTISRTLVRSTFATGCLGASFFFKRGEGDCGNASKFFTTIAAQFAFREPALVPYIQAALDSDPTITSKAIRQQFQKLMLDPLSKVSVNDSTSRTVLVVIDALDECDHDEDVKLLIQLLSRSNEIQQWQLKVFLTSRPELPIRLGFKAVQGTYQSLILHQISGNIVEQDIVVFLQYEFARIRTEYNATAPDGLHLLPSWPPQADIQTLAQRAVPLFIFAATVCRFICDEYVGDPKKQLQEVLKYWGTQESQLDATYQPILDQLDAKLKGRQRADLWERFQDVIGSIITLADPLSMTALAQLLDRSDSEIHGALRHLHSVLSVPSDGPIRLFHLSFRDFLLDPEKSDRPFWIDKTGAHKKLADQSLRILAKFLRVDLCNVTDPGTLVSDIDPQDINDRIRPEVQYACRYWVYHLVQSQTRLSDGCEVHSFLTAHFLHWLEALTWIQRVSEGFHLLGALENLVVTDNGSHLLTFLHDARRFAANTTIGREYAPLQFYSSGLLFTPKGNTIRTTFADEIPSWITLHPEVDDWDDCEPTLEGHISLVYSVVFSPDGAIVASASGDRTVRLWDTATGTLLQALKGHNGEVWSAVFSPDGAVVASASSDQTVRLWNTATGTSLYTLKGHTDLVDLVAFSPDGAVVASSSEDETIRLWDAATGTCFQKINIGTTTDRLSFNEDGVSLITNVGTIAIPSGIQPVSTSHVVKDTVSRRLLSLGISNNRYWITQGGRNLLWLPAETRRHRFAVYSYMVALSNASGAITIIRFAPDIISRFSI